MKLIDVLIALMPVFLYSCEQEKVDDSSSIQHINIIDTVICSNETFEYNLGYFSEEDTISIISFPAHSKTCELYKKSWASEMLLYQPKDDFQGIDTILIKAIMKTNKSIPSTITVTFTITLQVVKDEFQKKLTRKWNWTKSCGGYTGGCWYPDKNNIKQIEFLSPSRYIEKFNNSIVIDCQYQILDTIINGGSKIYNIEMIGHYKTFIWFSVDKLQFQRGDFVEEYEQSK